MDRRVTTPVFSASPLAPRRAPIPPAKASAAARAGAAGRDPGAAWVAAVAVLGVAYSCPFL